MKFDSTSFSVSLELCIVLFCAFSIIYLGNLRKEQNRWLLFAYVAMGFPFLNLLLGSDRYDILPYTPLLQNPSPILLFFPAIYLYTLKLVKPRALSNKRAYLLFIPFVLFYWVFVGMGFEHPEELFYDHQPPIHIVVFILFNALQAIVYLWLILKLVQFTQQHYQEQFADNSPFITLTWVKWVMYIIVLVAILQAPIVTKYLFEGFSSRNITLMSILLVISILNYFAFRQRVLYPTQQPILPAPESSPHTPSISAISADSPSPTLSDTEKEELIQRLEEYMRSEQPYLNPKIRMPELARAVEMPRHVFSSLINEHYQMNFFHFINKYRVEYAQALLTSKAYQHYTLEAIGNLSGFNSRSTFNRIFKNMTDKSPKEFQQDSK